MSFERCEPDAYPGTDSLPSGKVPGPHPAQRGGVTVVCAGPAQGVGAVGRASGSAWPAARKAASAAAPGV